MKFSLDVKIFAPSSAFSWQISEDEESQILSLFNISMNILNNSDYKLAIFWFASYLLCFPILFIFLVALHKLTANHVFQRNTQEE